MSLKGTSVSTSGDDPAVLHLASPPVPEEPPLLLQPPRSRADGDVDNQAFLYVERGPGSGQLFPIKPGTSTIGRGSDSDIRLLHPSISRKHARLSLRRDRFFVQDLGSQNGTLVNRARIERETELLPGDSLSIGNAVLKLRGSAAVSSGEARRKERTLDASSSSKTGQASIHWARIVALSSAAGFILAGILILCFLRLARAPHFRALTAAAPIAGEVESEAILAPHRKTARHASILLNKGAVIRHATPPSADSNEQAPPKPRRIQVASRADESPQASERAAAPSPPKLPASVPKSEDIKEQKYLIAAKSGIATSVRTRVSVAEDRELILAHFADGDIASALEVAKDSGMEALTSSLSLFRSHYAAGKRALALRDVQDAQSHFTAALDIDRQLVPGGTEYTTEIRKTLNKLRNSVSKVAERSTGSPGKVLSAPVKNPASAIEAAFQN